MEQKPTLTAREIVTNARLEARTSRDAVGTTPTAATTTRDATVDTVPLEQKGSAEPMSFKAIAVDESGEHGVIIGIGAVAGNVDKDRERLSMKGLVDMSYDFCADKSRVLKLNHSEIHPTAELVASWPGAPILKSGRVLAPSEAIPADDPVVGINIEKGKETHWFTKIRPNDPEILKAAREGKLDYSWGAHIGKRTAVSA